MNGNWRAGAQAVVRGMIARKAYRAMWEEEQERRRRAEEERKRKEEEERLRKEEEDRKRREEEEVRSWCWGFRRGSTLSKP